jgi:hypothetical protein
MAVKDPEAPAVGGKGLQADALEIESLGANGSVCGTTPNLPAVHRSSYSGRYRCASDRGAARRRLKT